MNKYRIVGTILLTLLLGFIYLAFSGQEEQAPSQETPQESESGYSGLGK